MNDTGILKYESNALGRWVESVKDGRKRTICFIARDEKDQKDDQTYVGYYYDVNDTDNGCNLGLSVSNESIDIQYVKPGDKEGKTLVIKSYTHEEFMNLLDALLK